MKHLVAVSSVFVVAMVLAASTRVVRAQPASDPMSIPAPAPAEEVSPAIAAALSIGGTVAAGVTFGIGLHQAVRTDDSTLLAIGAIGTVVLPSVGRWYAHAPAPGGLVVRAVGLGAMVGAIYISFHDEDVLAGTTMFVAGAAGFVGATLYDIIQAPRDALAYNAHLHDVVLVPMVQPDHHTVGLALSGRF